MSATHTPIVKDRTLSPGEAELIASSKPKEVNCPVCGSGNYELYCNAPSHYTPETYRITQCKDCQMVFTNPQFTFYDKVAETRGVRPDEFAWENLEATYTQGFFWLDMISQFTKGRRVMDFGCGTGSVVGAGLKAGGWDIAGYDLNVEGMERANKYWKTKAFESGSFETYFARHGASYDAAMALQVFEHLTDPVAVGKLVVQLIKPGGIFLIDVPNVRQLGERRNKGITLDPTAHMCHFSIDTLSTLMDKLGLEVIYKSGAPSFYAKWRKLGLGNFASTMGRFCKAILPDIGTGACVIGRKPLK